MFSQLRNAVESLAQQQTPPRRPGHERSVTSPHDVSSDHSAPHGHHIRSSGSLDLQSAGRTIGLSTGQLAESALSNLKKSFGTQRAGSPSPTVERPPTQPDREQKQTPKYNLEERLRATFAIGDASTATTPEAPSSSTSSPGTPAVTQEVVPTSVPLPLSPTLSSSTEREMVTFASQSLPSRPTENASLGATDVMDEPVIKHTPLDEIQYPEAAIPLPPPSPELDIMHEGHELPVDSVPVARENDEYNVAALQDRLKLLEQRFADVSNSFKQLQADRDAADKVLRDLTSVDNIADENGLREFLKDMAHKNEVSQEEIKRLNSKLHNYDERIEELRDTHRLESHSQSEQVENLRKQVEEAEALLQSAHNSTARVEEESKKRQAEIDSLQSEVHKAKGLAKEEEEKRTKAISLLKTVRQKLVKAEKERDDAIREADTLKERDKADRDIEKAERIKLETEIETARAEKERDITGLKAHFDRELTNLKDRLEKEHAARKGQFELEAISVRAAHQKEIDFKNSRISSLEISVRSLSEEKDNIFDQLQMRQAELESSQTHLESLQNSTTELQFQLREATERVGLLSEELSEAHREQDYRSLKPSASAEEYSRMLSAVEAKHEAKLGELNSKLATIEKERNETEIALSRNFRQKMQEAESLRKLVDSSSRTKEDAEEIISGLRQETDRLKVEIAACQKQVRDWEQHSESVTEREAAFHKQLEESTSRSEYYEQQIREMKGREAQLRANSKALREELRKVQSSAALLDRQRNPGIGYWGNALRSDNSSDARLPSSSSSDLPSAASSPRTGSPTPSKEDEEVNLEYLRNVILQFLEHKEMRPHLVKVLSIILHFTPQETRRLVAKV